MADDEPRRSRSAPEQHSGQQLDDPNREAVGLEPAWVEGTGGSGAVAGKTKGNRARSAATAEKAAEKPAEAKAD